MSTEIEKARAFRHKYAAEHGISPDGEDVWTDEIVAAYASERVEALAQHFDQMAEGFITPSEAAAMIRAQALQTEKESKA